jgi:hypothetical protein
MSTAWFQLYEVPTTVKLKEAEHRMAVAKDWEKEKESC